MVRDVTGQRQQWELHCSVYFYKGAQEYPVLDRRPGSNDLELDFRWVCAVSCARNLRMRQHFPRRANFGYRSVSSGRNLLWYTKIHVCRNFSSWVDIDTELTSKMMRIAQRISLITELDATSKLRMSGAENFQVSVGLVYYTQASLSNRQGKLPLTTLATHPILFIYFCNMYKLYYAILMGVVKQYLVSY